MSSAEFTDWVAFYWIEQEDREAARAAAEAEAEERS